MTIPTIYTVKLKYYNGIGSICLHSIQLGVFTLSATYYKREQWILHLPCFVLKNSRSKYDNVVIPIYAFEFWG